MLAKGQVINRQFILRDIAPSAFIILFKIGLVLVLVEVVNFRVQSLDQRLDIAGRM